MVFRVFSDSSLIIFCFNSISFFVNCLQENLCFNKQKCFVIFLKEYKKPLEESNPPILGANKISTLFHRLPEILQCHTLFRLALSECARTWDKEEKIGDVFVANFSKAVVLDIYSDFINNFSQSLEVAKQESKRKSALADFLKVSIYFL